MGVISEEPMVNLLLDCCKIIAIITQLGKISVSNFLTLFKLCICKEIHFDKS